MFVAIFVYLLMLVSMTLTLMQGYSGSAKANIQCWIISTTKQAINITLATTVGFCILFFSFFTWPWLWKGLYDLTTLFVVVVLCVFYFRFTICNKLGHSRLTRNWLLITTRSSLADHVTDDGNSISHRCHSLGVFRPWALSLIKPSYDCSCLLSRSDNRSSKLIIQVSLLSRSLLSFL